MFRMGHTRCSEPLELFYIPGASHIDSVGPHNVDTSQSGSGGVLISPNLLFISSEKLIMALNGDCFELRGHGALTTSVHYLKRSQGIPQEDVVDHGG
jgi:hypothetical protein